MASSGPDPPHPPPVPPLISKSVPPPAKGCTPLAGGQRCVGGGPHPKELWPLVWEKDMHLTSVSEAIYNQKPRGI